MTTIEELNSITEKESSGHKQNVVELLLQAMNDWRTPIQSVEDYSEHLKTKLTLKVISKDTIETELQRLNPATHSWEIESISSLLEAFQLSGTEDIHSLVAYIKQDNR